jgi:hypothetical protein
MPENEEEAINELEDELETMPDEESVDSVGPTPDFLDPSTLRVEEIIANLGNRKWRLQNLYHVKNEQGNKELFTLRPVQEFLLDNLWFYSIIPKSRQLGITTFFAILYLDAILFSENKEAVIIVHKLEDQKKIFHNKIKFAWNHMHPWVRRYIGEPETNNAYELRFPNGGIISATMSNRGSTAQFVHCLHPETEILLPGGYAKKVTELTPNETIISGSGRPIEIERIVEQTTSEKMLEIDAFGYYEPLRVTEKHKVLCRSDKSDSHEAVWKEAGEIKVGDYLAYPIVNPSRKSEHYDFDLGRICGLYLAEGSLRRTELTLSLHKDEVPEVTTWLEKYKGEYTSLRIYQCKTSKTSMLNLCKSFSFDTKFIIYQSNGFNNFISLFKSFHFH